MNDRKKFIIAEIASIAASIALGATLAYGVVLHNWNSFIPENIVAYMYTYTCDQCGYELAEGDYSIVSEQGFEFCPECHYHREYQNEKDSALFK